MCSPSLDQALTCQLLVLGFTGTRRWAGHQIPTVTVRYLIHVLASCGCRHHTGEVKHHKNVDLEPGTLSTLVMSSWSVLDNLEI